MDRAHAEQLDARTTWVPRRDRFALPDATVYLDGNSLGPLPVGVAERLERTLAAEWGVGLIRSWNDAGWFDLAERVGARVAALVGASPTEVVITDSTSVNLFKVVAAAARMRPGRRVLLTTVDNFPTDRYVIDELASLVGDLDVRAVPPDALRGALDGDVAALVATHVDFRTSQRLPAAELTEAAHEVGALAVWDLAHSAGAIHVDLHDWDADLAVGCTYKYLNGGPGAPGYVYVADRHAPTARNPIAGWWGHAHPFDFAESYRPAPGARGFQVGTPPVLSLTSLDAALDVWDDVDLSGIDAQAASLTQLFVDLVDQRCADLGVEVVTPRVASQRGAQVTVRHDHAYPVMQALIERGVIGDVRRPDLLRFGFAPLYVRHVDVWDAVEVLRDVLETQAWRDPRHADEATVI